MKEAVLYHFKRKFCTKRPKFWTRSNLMDGAVRENRFPRFKFNGINDIFATSKRHVCCTQLSSFNSIHSSSNSLLWLIQAVFIH